jgi:hypothetical protein
MARQFYSNANCMGYAFGKNKWMIPHGWDTDVSEGVAFIKHHFRKDIKFYKEYSANQGHQMVQQLPVGKSFVVYRQDDKYKEDFHFVKRLPTGHWRHKVGGRSIQPVPQKWVVQRAWPFIANLTYNSSFYVFELL